MLEPSGFPMFPILSTSLPELAVASPNEVILLAKPSMSLKAVFKSESRLEVALVLDAAATEDDELDEATTFTDDVAEAVTSGLATAMIGEAVAVGVVVGVATADVEVV